MNECKQALVELRDKVKAGEEVSAYHASRTWPNGYAHAINAGAGSLDAAKALHEAVLPGWHYNLAPGYCHVLPPKDNGDQEASTGQADNPARAWLIAILSALIEKEPK
jgi:hypothetical protein